LQNDTLKPRVHTESDAATQRKTTHSTAQKYANVC